MQVRITNQTPRLMICMLNSGRTIHLGPAQASEPIEHLEINGNPKLEKLERTGLVTIAPVEAEAESGAEETHERTGAGKATASAAAHSRKERK